MYLRMTKRRNADGSEVRYYQLAENEWDTAKGCAVAKVVYNFGRADELDPEKLRRLADSIVRFFPASAVSKPRDDIRILQSWPYGGIYVLEALWREVGLCDTVEKQLRAAKVKQPFERALFTMLGNRALAPYSKLYAYEQWVPKEVFLPSARALELHHFYFGMTFLEENKEAIEKAVYFRMADLMNADVDLIFYDTTTFHCEIDEEDEVDITRRNRSRGQLDHYPALRKRGHAKNGRDDAPLVVVALAVTRDGLPVRSWVFPGNTTDVTTVEKVKQDLRGWRLGRCLFVGDAGMNSAENRHTLARGHGKYILAAKMRAGDEVSKQVLTRAGRYHTVRDNLRVKEVTVGGDGARRQRYVVCHNPDEATRQQRHRQRLLELLTAELATLAAPKRKEGHSKRTCELLTSGRFGKYLRQTQRGRLKIDRAAVAREAKLDGKWVITTNDDTLTVEDLALGYKQLMRVEECWRNMKSGLRTRPMFHWRPHRICAHVTLCVLSLLLERIAEIRAGDTWRNIRAQLQEIKVTEYERGGVRVLQTTELEPATVALLKRLGVPPPPRLHEVREASPA